MIVYLKNFGIAALMQSDRPSGQQCKNLLHHKVMLHPFWIS